jgi:hypothetical protein
MSKYILGHQDMEDSDVHRDGEHDSLEAAKVQAGPVAVGWHRVRDGLWKSDASVEQIWAWWIKRVDE